VLAEGKDERLGLSCRNIPGVTFKRAAAVNAYDLWIADSVLLTKPALTAVEEVFSG
jgi:ribosomal protein L4